MRKPLAKSRQQRPGSAVLRARRLMPVRRKGAKWIVDASNLTPDNPEWGDYDTRAEAAEDRDGVIRTRGAAEVLALIQHNQQQQLQAAEP
jgi:hypothetical protein